MDASVNRVIPGQRPARLADPVVADVIARVVSAELEPGSLLPAEGELVATYGVSRGTLREAIKSLETKGIVHAHQGRGTVILARSRWRLLDPMVLSACIEHDASQVMFRNLTSVRIAIESELSRSAATNITSDQLQQMSALIGEMKRTRTDPARYLELDIAFHAAIADASGNDIAQAIMSAIEEPSRSMRRISNRIPKGIATATEFHLRIYECLSTGDADAAAAAMTEHLLWSRDHLDSAPKRAR